MEEFINNDVDEIDNIQRKASMFCPYIPEDKEKRGTKKQKQKKPEKRSLAKKILTKVFGF